MRASAHTSYLLRDTVPILRSEDEQTWDAREAIEGCDTRLRQFWASRAPGSGAPECLMAGALQSLENKGFRLHPDCERLLSEGLAAMAQGDFERLHRVDMMLRAHMRAATPDPVHPSSQSLRFKNWEDFAATVKFPAAVRPDDSRLVDSVRAGWLGQLVGAAAGTALEGYSAENIQSAFGRIDRYVRPPNTYNDDLTFELAFLETFLDRGHSINSTDIAAAWTGMIPLGWSAEGVALDALRRGVLPPESGCTDNPFDEWIGAQMRGVICGMVAPGNAAAAARLAWTDAEISHAGNGILGEVFNAVLAARAFVVPEISTLLDEAIAVIPAGTEYHGVVTHARNVCTRMGDWRRAWAECDALYSDYNWIHVYPNAAAQVIGLWFGDGDFDRTLEVICGIGHDVDCNAAQMLGVLGIAKGSSIIASRWTDFLAQGEIVTYMRRPVTLSLDDLVDQTLAAIHRHSLPGEPKRKEPNTC